MQLFLWFCITVLIIHTPFVSLIKHVCRLLGHDVCRSLLLWIHNVFDVWNMFINMIMIKHVNVYLWICIINLIVELASEARSRKSLEVMCEEDWSEKFWNWHSNPIRYSHSQCKHYSTIDFMRFSMSKTLWFVVLNLSKQLFLIIRSNFWALRDLSTNSHMKKLQIAFRRFLSYCDCFL